MADTEKMLARYKAELAAVMDRCLAAEEDAALYKDLKDIYSRDYYSETKKTEELKQKLADGESYTTELLGKLDVLKEWIEEHGGDPERILTGEPEETEEEIEWVKEDG